MTGLTQVAIEVFLYRCFSRPGSTVLTLATVFGVLCGILQTAGFIRWAILIPHLAAQMASADPAATKTLAIVEGAFNRYAGVALGEHTANICLWLWTMLVGAAMRREPSIDPRVSLAGIGLGAMAMVVALEQLEVAPALLALVLDFGFPAWAVWLVVLAVSLWRADTAEGPRLGWRTWSAALALYLGMVLPALL